MKKSFQRIALFALLPMLIGACVNIADAAPTNLPEIIPIATDTPGAAYGGEPENELITIVPPSSIKVALIAIADNGVSGPVIGCEDSVVMVEFPYMGGEPLTEALTYLLTIKDQYYGESGLYDALYQSTLQVERVETYAGFTEVYLTGQPMMGGECDIPRVQAQLEYTALQFPDVVNINIFLNGELLAEALSLK